MRTSAINSYLKCLASYNQCVISLRLHCFHRLLIRNNIIAPLGCNSSHLRWKSGKDDLSSVVIPVPITPANNLDDINLGEALSRKINKDDILKLINQFYKQPEVKIQSAENGLDSKLFHQASISFRKFCMESESLPVDLHIVFSDILQGAGHIHDILPYFLQHAKQIFPHLECMEELKQISDLRQPANWYPGARSIHRKLIFHAGPTNSGKTYRALERFIEAKSGVYCGPLKLLSVEVFNKTNERGTPCDLVTGEERQLVLPENQPASHVACTIEMVSVENRYEVAVIDEIQMIRDPARGWAWTRALLGLAAEEIHICGEGAAIDLIREIASSCGEELEVRRYERLTSLTIENKALADLSNIQPGDCIVCFNKNDIFNVSLELEKKGYECAVIYGGLPPGTKLAQAKKFNDPNHPCKILVATDAIGMGLNLSIRRIIFYSLIKPVINEKGEKEIVTISTSQALQIGGRAGRYNTQFSEGFVTTFRNEDLPILKSIMAKTVEPLEKAGLHPTADQVELFAYHLPQATLSNLIFSNQYSQNKPMTEEILCKTIGWPFSPPQNIIQLVHQEAVFDVLDLYLWLSYRFPDLFPDVQAVRKIQRQLDEIIQQGVFNITHLLKATDVIEEQEEHTNTLGKYNKNTRTRSSSVEAEVDGLEEPKEKIYGKGRLTKELLAQGLITPSMLKRLQKEWEQSLESSAMSSNEKQRVKKSTKVYNRRLKKK
ncbi:ATP-dependent RNA helicase SUPV3L1, mitochondrial-like isoform X2 [Stegodyphus dumicola]|uniref:ATP-dependent RNA helicase SUPV3L1, mitochondrial-like isoform X2 n=1 Tax=Stegodyphus dumicola TaxID=202533 RepID=UPI0015AD9BB0|nr:ATP-dependent RNA helicase SUPV3L1, mitochondrial-like isoform X2 [Stegodyphus dumicola]